MTQGKRTITKDTFPVIKEYIKRYSVNDAQKAFGVSETTIGRISTCNTFEDYINLMKRYNRKAYERRLNKTPLPSPFDDTTKNEGDGGNKSLFTKVNITPHENVDMSKYEVIKPYTGGRRNSVQPLSTTKLIKACDMARVGETITDIANALGFKNCADLRYVLSKDTNHSKQFNEALEEGKPRRREEINRRLKEAARKSDRVMNKPWSVKKRNMKKTAAEKGADTAAKNKGMTKEEFREWQKDNLARARQIKLDKKMQSTVKNTKKIVKETMEDAKNITKEIRSYRQDAGTGAGSFVNIEHETVLTRFQGPEEEPHQDSTKVAEDRDERVDETGSEDTGRAVQETARKHETEYKLLRTGAFGIRVISIGLFAVLAAKAVSIIIEAIAMLLK